MAESQAPSHFLFQACWLPASACACSVIRSQLDPLTSSLSCSPAAILALLQDMLNTLNPLAWMNLMAESQKGIADIVPGKWTRCAGRATMHLGAGAVRRSLDEMTGSDLQRQCLQSSSVQWPASLI